MAVDRESLFNQATAQRERWNYKVNYAQAEELRSKVNSGEIDLSSLPSGGSAGYSDILSVLEQVDEMASFAESGAGADWGEPPRRSGRPLEAPVTPVQDASDTTPALDPSLDVQASEEAGSYSDYLDGLQGSGDPSLDYYTTMVTPSDRASTVSRMSREAAMTGPVLRAALVSSVLSGAPVTESGTKAVQEYEDTLNPDGVYNREVHNAMEVERQETIDSAEDMIDPFDAMSIEEQLGTVSDYLNEIPEDKDVGFWSVMGEDIEVAKRLAVQDKAHRLLQEALDNVSALGQVVDFGKEILLPMTAWRNFRISGNPLGGEEFVRNLAENFRNLSPEEQWDTLDVINSWAEDVMSDNARAGLLNTLVQSAATSDYSDFSTFWAALDIPLAGVDLLGAAAGIAAVLRRQKTIKRLNDLDKRKDEIADGVAAAVVSNDGKASEMLGMSQRSVYNTASPFRTANIDIDSLDNLASATQERLVDFDKLVNAWTTDTLVEGSVKREAAFSPKERRAIEDKMIRELATNEKVDDVQVLSRDELGFDIRYQSTDESGLVTEMTDRINFSLSDKTALEVDTVGMIGRYLWSPLSFLKSDDTRDLARAAQRVDTQQAKVLSEYQELYRRAIAPVVGKSGLKSVSPMTRKKMADVDAVLLKGDKEKRVYSVDELKSGELGVRMSDDQVEVYYNIRKIMDAAHATRNHYAVRERVLRGERGLLVGDLHITGKPYETSTDAAKSMSDGGREFIFHPDQGSVGVSSLDLEDLYSQGYVVARLDQARDLDKTGNHVFYALVKSEDVVDNFPDELVGMREGYIPKVNLQAAYFVREFSDRIIDGKLIPSTSQNAASKTLRAFPTKADADAYAMRMTEEAIAKAEGKAPATRYEAYEDRELEKIAAQTSTGEDYRLGNPGAMYSGSRSDELLWGSEGIEGPRLDSFTSISRYLASLSKYMSRNEWRMGMEASIVKTANMLDGGGNQIYKTFSDLDGIKPDTDNRRIIASLRDQVRDWMGFRSADEEIFSYTMQKLIDSSLGQKLPKSARGALFSLKEGDIFATSRAAAFHGLLGWFNPIQLWIQAQGAAVAASMNIFRPDRLAVSLKDQAWLRTLQNVDFNPERMTLTQKAFNIGDKDRSHMLATAWKRSGFEESVYATADHAAAARGYGVGMDSLARAADSGLIFYREGEMFNRRLSFATAFDEWHRAAKPGTQMTDEILDGIMDRTNNLMLNMSKGNRAAWQRGVLGTATQFQQVSAKTVETLFGMNGNFTAAERVKILLGQGALYGAAGVPMGTMGARYFAEKMGYGTLAEMELGMEPETVKAMNEGFLGWATLSLFDVDVDIADRSSLWSGVESIIDEVLFGESTLIGNLAGASAGPVGDFWKGLVGAYEPLSLKVAQDKPYSVTNLATNPIIGSIKSFNNFDKALFMRQQGKILKKNGDTLIARDFTWREELAKAMGFSLTQEVATYSAKRELRMMDEYRDKVVQEMFRAQINAIQAADERGRIPDDVAQRTQEAMAALYQSLPESHRPQAEQALKSRITGYHKGESAQVLQEHREKVSRSSMDYMLVIQRLMKGDLSAIQAELNTRALPYEGIVPKEQREASRNGQ